MTTRIVETFELNSDRRPNNDATASRDGLNLAFDPNASHRANPPGRLRAVGDWTSLERRAKTAPHPATRPRAADDVLGSVTDTVLPRSNIQSVGGRVELFPSAPNSDLAMRVDHAPLQSAWIEIGVQMRVSLDALPMPVHDSLDIKQLLKFMSHIKLEFTFVVARLYGATWKGTYKVTIGPEMRCECPAFLHNRGGNNGVCKHILCVLVTFEINIAPGLAVSRKSLRPYGMNSQRLARFAVVYRDIFRVLAQKRLETLSGSQGSHSSLDDYVNTNGAYLQALSMEGPTLASIELNDGGAHTAPAGASSGAE